MTQNEKIILLLKQAGNAGFTHYELEHRHRITNLTKRISELKEQGFKIHTQTKLNGNLGYILLSEPPPAEILADSPFKYETYRDNEGRLVSRKVSTPAQQIPKEDQEGLDL